MKQTKPTQGPPAFAQSVHETIHLIHRVVNSSVAAEDISKAQFWTLQALSGRSASVSELAHQLAVTAPSISVCVDELESLGLVTRVRSTNNRRVVEVSLSSRGRKVEARVWARIERRITEAMEDLPEDEIATATNVVRELNRRLDMKAIQEAKTA